MDVATINNPGGTWPKYTRVGIDADKNGIVYIPLATRGIERVSITGETLPCGITTNTKYTAVSIAGGNAVYGRVQPEGTTYFINAKFTHTAAMERSIFHTCWAGLEGESFLATRAKEKAILIYTGNRYAFNEIGRIAFDFKVPTGGICAEGNMIYVVRPHRYTVEKIERRQVEHANMHQLLGYPWNPRAIACFRAQLYVAGKKQILRGEGSQRSELFAGEAADPQVCTPRVQMTFANIDSMCARNGYLYVLDAGVLRRIPLIDRWTPGDHTCMSTIVQRIIRTLLMSHRRGHGILATLPHDVLFYLFTHVYFSH